MPPKPAEILIERIDQRLAALGKTRWWLSMEITGGKQHGVIRDIQRRKSMPGGARLQLIAEKLETTTDWLLGRAETPAQVVSEVSFRDVSTDWKSSQVTGIPILGTGYCEDLVVDADGGEELHLERVLLETDHVVRMIERPAALQSARDAYAIYYHGSSMEPRFYQGEIGIVDPRRPPGPGDFVLVQLTDGTDDVVTVIVKQLVRVGGGFVHLKQFNPEQTFRIPQARVKRLHRIMWPTELLGG